MREPDRISSLSENYLVLEVYNRLIYEAVTETPARFENSIPPIIYLITGECTTKTFLLLMPSLLFAGHARSHLYMPFTTLGLGADILRAISEKGYNAPTPIQQQAIPVILAGRDILAGAQTGTGKTAGFTLPILQLLSARPAPTPRLLRALILTPTRELAAQVEESVRGYGKYTPLKSALVFGGVGFAPQAAVLRKGIDILVATPGRLLDHVAQRTIDLSHVEILVLDEADRMLDMGFIRDIRKILALLPQKRQNLLFSATFSAEIKHLADGLLRQPALIEVARPNMSSELVAQVVHPVDRERKRELLAHLIRAGNWEQVLVFTRTKHGANRLSEYLEKEGIHAAAIHGNKSQGARTRALAQFKQGEVRVLVATDIAARGLDIDQLPHVVNYELPNVPADYIHRIGRTGRAGHSGEALSLVCVDEHELMTEIEKLLKYTVPRRAIPGFAPDPTAQAQPLRKARGAGRQTKVKQQPAQGNPLVHASTQRPSSHNAASQKSFNSKANPRNNSNRAAPAPVKTRPGPGRSRRTP